MLKKIFFLGDSSPETDLGSTSVLVWGHRGGTQGGDDVYLGDDDGDNDGDDVGDSYEEEDGDRGDICFPGVRCDHLR